MTEKVSDSFKKAPVQNTEQDSMIKRIESVIRADPWTRIEPTALLHICKHKGGLFKLSLTLGSTHMPPLYICQSMIKAAKTDESGLNMLLINATRMTKTEIKIWEAMKPNTSGSHLKLVETLLEESNSTPHLIGKVLRAHVEKQGHVEIFRLLINWANKKNDRTFLKGLGIVSQDDSSGIDKDKLLNSILPGSTKEPEVDPTQNNNEAMRIACKKGDWEQIEQLLRDLQTHKNIHPGEMTDILQENKHANLVNRFTKLYENLKPTQVGSQQFAHITTSPSSTFEQMLFACKKGDWEKIKQLLKDPQADYNIESIGNILYSNGHINLIGPLTKFCKDLKSTQVDSQQTVPIKTSSPSKSEQIQLACKKGDWENIKQLLKDPQANHNIDEVVGFLCDNNHAHLIDPLFKFHKTLKRNSSDTTLPPAKHSEKREPNSSYIDDSDSVKPFFAFCDEWDRSDTNPPPAKRRPDNDVAPSPKRVKKN